MKNLSGKQKLIIGIIALALLLASYFFGSDNPFRKKEIASPEKIEEIRKEQSQDMHLITGDKAKSQEDQESTVRSISISGEIENVERNSHYQLSAQLQGEGDFPKEIIWQIEGQTDVNTWINEEGLLSIGDKEESSEIRILVTSATNQEVKSELNININNPYKKPVEKPTNKEELIEKAQEAELSEEEKAEKTKEQEAIKAQAIANSSGTAGQDKYLTDPVPEGKPKPVEPEEVTIDKRISKTATISISCETILENLDMFDKDKIDVLPVDGIILSTRQVTFYEGESVFDLLQRVVKDAGIHMEFVFTPIYNSAYVEGINNLYEFDCGPLSGWMYKVNGWFPNYGASRYKLEEGDIINWVYTCDLGADVGNVDFRGGK